MYPGVQLFLGFVGSVISNKIIPSIPPAATIMFVFSCVLLFKDVVSINIVVVSMNKNMIISITLFFIQNTSIKATADHPIFPYSFNEFNGDT